MQREFTGKFTTSELLHFAVLKQNEGKRSDSRCAYQAVLKLDPSNVDANHLLGVLEAQEGNYILAVELISRAVILSPSSAVIHDNLGVAYLRSGQAENARQSFAKAIALSPRYALGFHHLSLAYLELGETDKALDASLNSLKIDEFSTQFMLTTARILRRLGDLKNAKGWLQKSVVCDNRFVEGWNNLGLVEQDLGEFGPAKKCFDNAVQLNPRFFEAYNNLGVNFQKTGDWERAVCCFREATVLKPDYVEAHYNLATSFQYLERKDEAIDAYKKVLCIDSKHIGARCKLINLLQYRCDFESMIRESEVHVDLVDASQPTHSSQLASPFSFLTLPIPTTPSQQLGCAKKWSALTYPRTLFSPYPRRIVTRSKKRLVIGYVSADFHAHATSWLLSEALENHDRSQFQTIAYSLGPNDQSQTRLRMENGVETFRDVSSLNSSEIAHRIYADEVDILVDLKGYTKNSRTEIFAYRPAPIQVNFLGYPGTMGSDFIDYIVVDEFIMPKEERHFYSEKPIWMPHCYQPNDSRRKVPELNRTKEEMGLPRTGFVFCCFNNPYKITPTMFEVCVLVQRQLERSRVN